MMMIYRVVLLVALLGPISVVEAKSAQKQNATTDDDPTAGDTTTLTREYSFPVALSFLATSTRFQSALASCTKSFVTRGTHCTASVVSHALGCSRLLKIDLEDTACIELRCHKAATHAVPDLVRTPPPPLI